MSTPFANEPSRYDLETTAHAGRTNFRTTVVNLDRPGDPGVFDEQTRAEAAQLIARYPEGHSRSALRSSRVSAAARSRGRPASTARAKRSRRAA